MIPKGLFSQIAMIAMGVGIALFFIKPAFDDIQLMQDEIVQYQAERQKIDQVNNRLAQLVSRLNSVSADDQRRIVTYLPDEVDTMGVARVLQFMTQRAGLLLQDVSYDEIDNDLTREAELANETDYPVPHRFGLNVEGTYQQIKNFLELLEQNEFPLEVHQLSLSLQDENFLSADFIIVTYSHEYPEASIFINR